MDFASLAEDDLFVPIVAAVSIVLLTIIYFLFIKSDKTKRKYFVLLGTAYSGKTTLLSLIAYKKAALTYTSIKDNKLTARVSKPSESSSSSSRTIELVDIPGSDKIRFKYLDIYKKAAKALIFVIDSSTFTKENKDVAQYLFEVLTDDALAKGNVRLLIVCNKQDHENAKSKTFIQSVLEKELDLLRKIASSALKSTNEKSSRNKSLLSNSDKPFEFKDLRSFKVEFVEVNCVQGGESVEEVNDGASGDSGSSTPLKAGNIDQIVSWIYSNSS